MASLETGTLYIRSSRLEETAEHISRLSIRMMLNGRQWYKVGRHDRVIDRDSFLVIEEGQRYRTSFQDDRPLEMLMVGFRPGLAAEVFRTMTCREDSLIDDPHATLDAVHFAEQTYAMDPVIRHLFQHLHHLIGAPLDQRSTADLSGTHDRLMERLIELQFGIHAHMERLSAARRSTRLELWKRLNTARDHAIARHDVEITVADLARTACLSEYHFKRLFREAFGVPPHRFLRRIRLQRARELIRSGLFTVSDIPSLTGYSDVSSFIRMYKQEFGLTPGAEQRRTIS